MAKVISFRTACQLSKKFRQENKIVLFTSGCFDLIHLGHIEFFQKTRNFKPGSVFFVGVDTDEYLTSAKGQLRPIFSQQIRAKILSAIDHIDYVVLLEEKVFSSQKHPDFIARYKKIQPDYVVFGNTEESILKTIKIEAKKAGCKFKHLSHQRKLDSTRQIADRILKYFPS